LKRGSSIQKTGGTWEVKKRKKKIGVDKILCLRFCVQGWGGGGKKDRDHWAKNVAERDPGHCPTIKKYD